MFKELYGTSMIKYEDKEEILEYYILNDEEYYDLNSLEDREIINNNRVNLTNIDCNKCMVNNINKCTNSKIKMYGIEVVKKCENRVEKSFISDLTVNKTFVEQIIKSIKDNVVTPVHLYDVLENFL